LVGIYLIQDGLFRYVNPRLAEIFGYSVEELVDKMGPRDLTLPQDWHIVEENLRKRIDGEVEAVHYNFRGIKKNGEVIHLEVYGSRIIYHRRPAVIGTLLDITEQKKAEGLLRESEERYKRLLESVTDYIYTVEICDGKVVSTRHGPGCLTVTGYTKEEFESDKNLWYRIIFEEDRKAVIEQAEKILSGRFVQPIEHRIIHRDGSVRWVRNTPAFIHRDKEGNLIAYDGLIEDITERKRLEEELRHAQRMETIGQLVGGLAHEFNNIITAIIGYAHLLLMRMGEDDPLRIYVNQIYASIERAVTLTEGLLVFSRKQAINLSPVDINLVVRRVEDLLLRIIGEDIELITIPADRDLTVMANSTQIEQVLMNLATNARDAMPEGGVLTITTEPFEMDNEFIGRYGYGRPGMYALISVTDTGIGMDEKTAARIFEPFFTTKEPGKGTGLGLSVVYGIVKQHNGYITLESEVGKGTRFRIYLPLIKAGAEDVRRVGPVAMEGEEAILVADDDEGVRGFISEILQRFGYEVIEAIDGEDAINRFREKADRLDLLILNIVMPKMDGKKVYNEIRKIRPDIRTIFMSGYPVDIIRGEEILEEGLDFIAKPISPKELLRKVREVLER